jgi:hypothetical protein
MSIDYVGLRFRKRLGGGTPEMSNVPLVEGTYTDGNILRVSGTSGSAAKLAASGTAAAFVFCGNLDKSDWVATTKYPVYHLDENNVFEARMLASVTPQQKYLDYAGVAVGSTYNYRLQGTTTSGPLKIVGYPPDQANTAATNLKFYVTGAKSVWAGAPKTQGDA